MRTAKPFIVFNLLMLCLALTGCTRNPNEVWEDSKSAGRHVGRGFKTLGGKHGDSRMIANRDDFMGSDDFYAQGGDQGGDFIPLQDSYNSDELAMAESVAPQPRETPGDPGSSIPGIDAFRDPSTIPGLAGVFRNIHFDLNSNLIKGQDNLNIVHNVSDYMRRYPNTYVFVEGHCDERGPEAFNLSLGSRRSNSVRNLLIREGVNPDNIFTISYGKERPLLMDHHEEAWAQNRRAEFKVYQR